MRDFQVESLQKLPPFRDLTPTSLMDNEPTENNCPQRSGWPFTYSEQNFRRSKPEQGFSHTFRKNVPTQEGMVQERAAKYIVLTPGPAKSKCFIFCKSLSLHNNPMRKIVYITPIL